MLTLDRALHEDLEVLLRLIQVRLGWFEGDGQHQRPGRAAHAPADGRAVGQIGHDEIPAAFAQGVLELDRSGHRRGPIADLAEGRGDGHVAERLRQRRRGVGVNEDVRRTLERGALIPCPATDDEEFISAGQQIARWSRTSPRIAALSSNPVFP